MNVEKHIDDLNYALKPSGLRVIRYKENPRDMSVDIWVQDERHWMKQTYSKALLAMAADNPDVIEFIKKDFEAIKRVNSR